MKKELRPTPELHSCEVCHRTILKGEPLEAYLAPGGQRKVVCELCARTAERAGWIRESAHADLPATRSGPEPRRSLFGRLGLRRPDSEEGDANGHEPPADEDEEWGPEEVPEPGIQAERAAPAGPEPPSDAPASAGTQRRTAPFGAPPRRDTRHVRAVPTNAQVKVERALEVFNGSEHRRTVAGLARTLGEPWVSAYPNEESPSEVNLVVAWELSWYQYRVDLGDAHHPITLFEKGHELAELRSSMREWNGSVTADGALLAAFGGER